MKQYISTALIITLTTFTQQAICAAKIEGTPNGCIFDEGPTRELPINKLTDTPEALSLYISTGENQSITTATCFLKLYAEPKAGERYKGLKLEIKGSYWLAQKGRSFLALTSQLIELHDKQSFKLRIDTETEDDGVINDIALLTPQDNTFGCGEPVTIDIGIYSIARRIRQDQQETILDINSLNLQPVFETFDCDDKPAE
ncbi:MAG: hypothetical protein P8Y42_18965 [Exilibacterium sp.]